MTRVLDPSSARHALRARRHPANLLALDTRRALAALGLSVVATPIAAETCPAGPDADGDGVCDARDNCRTRLQPGLQVDVRPGRLRQSLRRRPRTATGWSTGLDCGEASSPHTARRTRETDYALEVDADGNGVVDLPDFDAFVRAVSGKACPGPSGLGCAGSGRPARRALEAVEPGRTRPRPHDLRRDSGSARADRRRSASPSFLDEQLRSGEPGGSRTQRSRHASPV